MIRVCVLAVLVAIELQVRVPLWKIRVPAEVACTTTTADAERATVSSAITAATAGDVICLPTDTATWTSNLTFTKAVTLKGAGVGNTVITAGFSASGDGDLCGHAILCYDPASPALNQPVRVTAITFNGAYTAGCLAFTNSPHSSSAPITQIRADHNAFIDCGRAGFTQRAVFADGLSFGVIDNNTFTDCQKTFDEEQSDDYGWDVAADIGGPNSMYFEDNTIDYTQSRASYEIQTSGGQGGRYVLRFNTANTTLNTNSGQHYDVHGTLSDRGTVTAELYHNTLTTRTGAFQWMDLRGSTAIIFNNKVIKPASDITFDLREEDGASYPALDQILNSYFWKNTYGATTGLENNMPVSVTDDSCTPACLVANRDYWNYTASFDGTVGVGVGVVASRPATCTTGVAYWATDEGEWNSTNGATADGRLYKCISANTWALRYGDKTDGLPYAYPHPLRAGS